MKQTLLFAFSRRALARSAALFAMGLHALLFPSRLCGEATLLLAAYLFLFGSLSLRDGLLLRGPARMERLLCGVLGVALSTAALLWQRFEPETLPLLHGAFVLLAGAQYLVVGATGHADALHWPMLTMVGGIALCALSLRFGAREALCELLDTLLLMGALCEAQLRRAGRQLRYGGSACAR